MAVERPYNELLDKYQDLERRHGQLCAELTKARMLLQEQIPALRLEQENVVLLKAQLAAYKSDSYIALADAAIDEITAERDALRAELATAQAERDAALEEAAELGFNYELKLSNKDWEGGVSDACVAISEAIRALKRKEG